MNNYNDDLVTAGFKRLDSNLLSARPPKISWGVAYQLKSDNEKIEYLEKLASTMNHAAYLIQEERNKLGKLCELKEKQLISGAEGMRANQEMIHQEITRMNAERQGYNAEIARLNARVKVLEAEGGNND